MYMSESIVQNTGVNRWKCIRPADIYYLESKLRLWGEVTKNRSAEKLQIKPTASDVHGKFASAPRSKKKSPLRENPSTYYCFVGD